MIRITKNPDKQTLATTAKSLPCKFCSREFSSSKALGGHQNAHKKVKNPDTVSTTSKSFSCEFCSRKFSSLLALAGHQNAHKEERSAFENPSLWQSPLLFAPTLPQFGLINPAVYITAHAASLCQLPAPQLLDGFGSTGAPRFNNLLFYRDNYINSGYRQHEEDAQSYLNWRHNLCNEEGPHNGTVRENQRDESENKEQNLDLSLHL